MKPERQTVRPALAATLSLLLTACGGGDSGGNNVPPDNRPPVVTIDLPEERVMELSTITISAAGSSDPDDDELSFEWKQVAGPETVLSGEDSAEFVLRLPKVRNTVELRFALTVSDTNGASETAEFDLAVEEANGLLYVVAEASGSRDDLYFHHPALEEPLNLSADIAPDSDGFLGRRTVLPDHRHVAYTYSANDHKSLHIAALDGSEIRNVTGNVVDGANVLRLLPSPDGKWLAIHGDLETDNVHELFLLPTDSSDGNDRIKISGEITASDGNPDNGEIDGDVRYPNFTWLPDSSGVVFEGDLITDNEYELFVGRTNGEGTPLGIKSVSNIPHTAAFIVSPVENIVIFTSRPSDAAVDEIAVFAVYPDDSEIVELIRGTWPGFQAGSTRHAWSPDGSRLAFRFRKQDGSDLYELYLVERDGIINGSIHAIGSESGYPDANLAGRPAWSPNSEQLAFAGWALDGAFRSDLYVTSGDTTDGSELVRIPWPDENENDSASLNNYSFSPDGDRIAFAVWNNAQDRQHELHVAPLTGGLATRVSEPAAHDQAVGVHQDFTWINGGDSLVFKAQLQQNFRISELYRAEADGSRMTNLSGLITADEDGYVGQFLISPDESMIAFYGDLEVSKLHQVYVVAADATDGGERTRLSNAFADDLDGDGHPDGYAYIVGWVGPDPEQE